MKLNVLIVDDEPAILRATKQHLLRSGIGQVTTCQDSRDVMSLVSENQYDLILLDITMPHISGDQLLELIHKEYPHIAILIVSGNNDLELAIKCIQNGAQDYLIKPIEPSRLITSVKIATNYSSLNQEQINLKDSFFSDDLKESDDFGKVVTQNEDMFKVFKYIEAIAPSDFPVLILGETGVGKDLFAEAIHLSSKRKGCYIEVNVNEFEKDFFIDALFGHTKGAYTGASEDRRGLLEQAENGTIFLDEIGDLEMSQQVKLLRLIQNKEYRPIGSDEVKRTNARIIVATNKSLKKMILEDKFRKDLYFRLQTHEIQILPLRKRSDDIPVLTKYFLEKFSVEYNKALPTIENKTLATLKHQHFDGNVRELEQLILDITLTYEAGMDFHNHITERLSSKASDFVEDEIVNENVVFPEIMPTLKELNALAIEEALKRSGGKKSAAATLLGITASALSQRLNS